MIRLATLIISVPLLIGQVEASVADLEADPTAYDGHTVSMIGEVVGDYGIRSDVVWIQLNTDAYATDPLLSRDDAAGSNQGIGVRYPRALHDERWGEPGGYGVRGPLVEVVGTFRYNDDETSGETFIDAREISLVEPSHPIDRREPDRSMWIAAIAAALAGAASYGTAQLRRRRHPR